MSGVRCACADQCLRLPSALTARFETNELQSGISYPTRRLVQPIGCLQDPAATSSSTFFLCNSREVEALRHHQSGGLQQQSLRLSHHVHFGHIQAVNNPTSNLQIPSWLIDSAAITLSSFCLSGYHFRHQKHGKYLFHLSFISSFPDYFCLVYAMSKTYYFFHEGLNYWV